MDAQTLFVFKVGHSVYRRRNPTPDKTHHWRCWVESWSDQYPLSEFVNNVVFQLHETFKNPRQVVYKEPFSIEEDGFGNFRLLARVSFLNVVTDLHYDITLHDSRELYAFRTVRLDPKNYDEWIRFTQYGGIPIPKSANSYIIQQTVVEPIQSYGAKCNLPISHFYPDLTAAILDQTPIKFSSPIASSVPRSRPSRESRNQALANLGIPVTTNVSPAPLTNTTATTSSAVAYSGRYPPSLISSSSSFKHKKKLQLKHEAQLRLEKQSSSQSALPSSSSPSPSLPLPPTLQPMLSDSGSGSIISQNRGVPFVQQQQQQHERIVIRLLRSDIEKSKTKSKKKHKHKSRRLTDAAEDGQQQQQSSSNRMEWSSSRPPSGIPSYTQSSHTSLGGGEDHPIQPPSSFSASAIHSLPPDTAGVAVGSQKPSEQTETGTFPQMDSQQATLAWLSQLKAQPPSQTQPQSQQLPQLPSVEKGQVSKESNCKDSKSHRPRKESKRTHSPGPSKQETVHKPASAMDICNCLQRTSNEDRNRNIMSSMGLSPDSTPPMSVEPVPQPIPEDGNVANKLPGAYFDNEELEKLFDRLCGLRHEESAVRLGEILTRYGKRTDSDCGVTVVELPDSYPMVISFDLRKLPLPCVLELAQVALDDENMSTSPS
nr:Protein ENL [Hymenolepis microstoma]